MEREFLRLEVWDQLTEREARAVGEALGRCLPQPWRFDGVAFHEMGDQRRFVAFFCYERDRFALIPGHEATLGYERGSFVPTGEQLQWWEEARAEWGWKLDRLLDGCLTPLRRVTVAPFLLGTTYLGSRRTAKGVRTDNPPGFRRVTSDEWEYACGGGSRTLFRWGDYCPPGNPASHKEGYSVPLFTLHAEPNAFGLRFPHDTYAAERCSLVGAERGIVYRASDGGSGVCGGADHFAGWIPLMTAYEGLTRPDEDQALCVGERRAYSLLDEWLD